LLHHLHNALLHDPGLVERATRQSEKREQQDKNEYPVTHPSQIAQHSFQAGCREVPGLPQERNLLDYVFSYAKEAPGVSGIREYGQDLLNQFLSEVPRYYRFAYGPDRERQAENGAANLIEKLRKDSDVYGKESANSEVRRQWDRLIDDAVDNLQH
jgi:hypothetical protein